MPRTRGMTLIELLAVVACTVVLGPTLFPFLAKPPDLARQQKDQMQIGQIMVAMTKFADTHNGWYPLPGDLDHFNTTLAPTTNPNGKNTTANIFSLLIFNGFLQPVQFICPAESATSQVVVDRTYHYHNPPAAQQPAQALWDPEFSGTPADMYPHRIGISNQSYAHIIPIGNRRAQWRTTGTTLRPILGNRGPTYVSNDSAPYPAGGHWTLLNGPLGTLSNTLLIHGPRNSWEGHVAFNDGHVTFTTTPNPASITYTRASGTPRVVSDNLFVNESDEQGGDPAGTISHGTNAYLRPIVQVAGTSTNSVVLIWRD